MIKFKNPICGEEHGKERPKLLYIDMLVVFYDEMKHHNTIFIFLALASWVYPIPAVIVLSLCPSMLNLDFTVERVEVLTEETND